MERATFTASFYPFETITASDSLTYQKTIRNLDSFS
jgi:hypothetical protein